MLYDTLSNQNSYLIWPLIIDEQNVSRENTLPGQLMIWNVSIPLNIEHFK